MDKQKIVLIGSGCAGLNFIKELKNLDEDKNNEILWISKEEFMTKKWLMDSYIVKEKDENVIIKIEKFIKEKNINANFIKDEILSINTKEKILKGKFRNYNYDKLIIATGSKAKLPRIECDENSKKRIVAFNCFDDFKIAKEILKDSKNVSIVGAGPIGFELSINLSKNFNVNLIEFESDIMLALLIGKPTLRSIARKILALKGVKLFLSTRAYKFKEKKLFCENLETKENFEIPTDLIIFAAGIKQNLPMIDNYTFETEEHTLICNDFGEAWIREEDGRRIILKDVYAIGDCCYYLTIGNYPGSAMFSERSARIVAYNIFQKKYENKKRIDFNPSIYSKIINMILRRI